MNKYETQRELLKTALDATDAYLGIEKNAIAAGKATPVMIHDFSFQMTRAHEALQALGELDKHQEYMTGHVKLMAELSDHDDQTLSDLPYTHVPKADFGGVEESVNDNTTIADEELDRIADQLEWEDIIDFYDDDELETEEELNEVLSVQARLKKKQSFARFKGKRNIAKRIKLARASDTATLQRRAKLAARRALYKRFLKGRDKSSLSPSEKARIEQQVANMKSVQANLAMKMMPRIRTIERQRLTKRKTK